MGEPLLQVKNLHVHFPLKGNPLKKKKDFVKAINGVELSINQGETLGVVGESGCGKSTLARTIIGLEKPTSGDILFEGESITNYTKQQLHELRKNIQMVFQDPYTSLHPRMNVGEIIAAPLKAYKVKGNIPLRVKELMELVGLNPDDHYERLPHEFSGGQRQRIGIARAIALKPKVIICDEPVSALDVSVQAQVINLLKDLQEELNLTYLFIAHDLSVIKHIANKIAVMYLGKIVEISEGETFFSNAQHPYTNALISAIPLPDPQKEKERHQIVLKGDLPSPVHPPSGCVFHTRCPFAQYTCKRDVPTLRSLDEKGHSVACFYPKKQEVLNDAIREE